MRFQNYTFLHTINTQQEVKNNLRNFSVGIVTEPQFEEKPHKSLIKICLDVFAAVDLQHDSANRYCTSFQKLLFGGSLFLVELRIDFLILTKCCLEMFRLQKKVKADQLTTWKHFSCSSSSTVPRCYDGLTVQSPI